MEVLDDIPVELDFGEVLARLHIKADSPRAGEVEEAVALAHSLAHPRAVYEVSYVEERDGDRVRVGSVWFTSRVLRKNLEEIHRVFPHVVTIGSELEEALSSSDVMVKYYLDSIGNMILGSSRRYLENCLTERYRLGGLSRMNPGSLADWPIEQQGQLFSVFGDVEGMIGVRLTGDSLMIPAKSVSGIFFPTEVPFHSCQLCPRPSCIGRRAPYDREMAEQYGIPV
jgi:hypothetical protein